MDDSVFSDILHEKQCMNLVKQEIKCSSLPSEIGTASASVPIPKSYRDSQSVQDHFSPSPLANPALWGNSQAGDFLLDSPFKVELQDSLEPQLSFKMDDDDIFQVEKSDLIQGPTLAELNANEDTLLNDLNFDDLLLPNETVQTLQNIPPGQSIYNSNIHSSHMTHFAANNFPQQIQGYQNYLKNSEIVHVAGPIQSVNPVTYSYSGASNTAGFCSTSSPVSLQSSLALYQSSAHELSLEKLDYCRSGSDQSSSSLTKPKVSRLSMSAPTQSMGLDQIWARREPRQHLISTGSLGVVEAGSSSSLSTGGALSPNPLGYHDPLSHDEGYEDSEDDSDHYDDYSTENDSGGSDDEDNISNGKFLSEPMQKDGKQKKEKYFWQYNVQAKGPKGQRLVARSRLENPHVLNEATDPVFSPHCALRGIKHSGKARKGDGNDLTPNPRKLQNIGKELDKLSQIINDMTPVSELPFMIRPKTRKEKNKLASRACRLKKKAQHEANKIKLHGLEQEHKRLIQGIIQAKSILTAKVAETKPEIQEELTRRIEKIFKNATKLRIANHSTEFVNKVLDEARSGIPVEEGNDF